MMDQRKQLLTALGVAFLSWAAVFGADLDVAVVSEGESTVYVTPSAAVNYEITGQLTDTTNEGLAGFVFDLTFSGGTLTVQVTPGDEMTNFVVPNGITNPAGFGGAMLAGQLIQVGGAQNTINNSAGAHLTGPVDTGIGHTQVVLATGALTAPRATGEYTLHVSNMAATVIQAGEVGPVWATEVAGAGTIEPLAIIVPARRPMPEDCADIPPGNRCSDSETCTTDDDCTEESHCVLAPVDQPELGNVCYAPKTRYLSIGRNPAQADYTMRRVMVQDGYCQDNPAFKCVTDADCVAAGATGPCVPDPVVLGWVDTPYEHLATGLWLAEIVDAPVLVETWPDMVHVYGCEIAHASLSNVTEQHCKPNPIAGENCVHHSYHIQAIVSGADTLNEANYSEVLELKTNTTWGDTVTSDPGGLLVAPDGIPGLADIMAAICYFQGDTTIAPLTWLDIAPSNNDDLPDQNVGLPDVSACIAGFQGQPYPGDGPLGCP